MKHEAINVDNPESFKESVLDVIQWTEATIKEAFHRELDACGVNEDAGVRLKLPITTYRKPGAVVAWMEIPVTSYAEPVYKPRLDAAATNLSKLFHVEQSQREGDRDEITHHRISIRYEYPGSV
jgi:hypothetical protein